MPAHEGSGFPSSNFSVLNFLDMDAAFVEAQIDGGETSECEFVSQEGALCTNRPTVVSLL